MLTANSFSACFTTTRPHQALYRQRKKVTNSCDKNGTSNKLYIFSETGREKVRELKSEMENGSRKSTSIAIKFKFKFL